MFAVCVSAVPGSTYVAFTVAPAPSCSGAAGPETDVIAGATFVAVTVSMSLPWPLPRSVTVTETSYEPSSSGVKLKELLLPLAYGEPFFVTDQAYVNDSPSSTSSTLTVAVTPLPSAMDDGTVMAAVGRSLTESTLTFTVATAQSDGVPLSQTS